MIRIYKYRLVGNSRCFDKAEQWLNMCRYLYNIALAQKIMIYRQNKGRISCYSQINQLPELKKEYTEYYGIAADVLQDVIERLDRSYEDFFRRAKYTKKAGFPRFKGKDRYSSFTIKSTGWKLDGKYFTINKIGRFKLRLSRTIEGRIKRIIICRDRSDHWYACFYCDVIPKALLPKSNKSIGLDVGIKSLVVDSDGNTIDNPQYFRTAERGLRIKQRVLSRRKLRSKRRKVAKLSVSKAHKKIQDQRNDFLHKTANYYVANYDNIYIEDLNVQGLMQNKHLGKSVSDTSWGKFFGLLTYKAAEAGREVVSVPPQYTSNTCSECGAINKELKLSDRQWICKECGVLHDRDYNAAKNIKRVGQTQQALTCVVTQSVACKSPRTTKRRVSMRSVRNINKMLEECHD